MKGITPSTVKKTNMPRALIGTIYMNQTTLARPLSSQIANMAPIYAMPETTAGAMPATVVDQVIPGITTTLPTPANPTVQSLNAVPIPGVTPSNPWYQWFVNHPLYTGLIGVGLGAGLVLVFRKKKRK